MSSKLVWVKEHVIVHCSTDTEPPRCFLFPVKRYQSLSGKVGPWSASTQCLWNTTFWVPCSWRGSHGFISPFLSLSFFFFPSERKKDSLLPAGSRDFSQSMSLCPHSCADPDHLTVLRAEKALVPVVHGTAQPPLFIVWIDVLLYFTCVPPPPAQNCHFSKGRGTLFLWSLWLNEAQSLTGFPHYQTLLCTHKISYLKWRGSNS